MADPPFTPNTETATRPVLGVDACKTGWVGILLNTPAAQGHDAVPPPRQNARCVWAPTISDLIDTATGTVGRLAVVAIDIPIGLPDTTTRAPDTLARTAVGARASSVFSTPPRAAIGAPTHAEANRIGRELTGKGVSAQAFGLAAKLLDVDAWVRDPHSTARRIGQVVEVHPEVSFAELAQGPVSRKTTWAGLMQRRALLERAGIHLPDDLGTAGASAAADDVLDASVAAWSATRVAAGIAHSLPDPPVRYGDGWACAIWV
ncbi:DUF429 domain-containing protein [Nocardioides sp.]|uniref:DUF429 domain-containing protein n=1 Tax=Nocardioides sp. TaxID=35761 RepID=UPI00273345C3|nr:DUF429 domain-containing protein [Nocardioides sp.]MDP3890501.1 DUF429 domain-containing protein [Nocardioides sp.]